MESSQVSQEKAAIQIIAKACEGYINSLADELSKAFVTPQVQAALQIIGKKVEANWPVEKADQLPLEPAKEPVASTKAKGGMNKK